MLSVSDRLSRFALSLSVRYRSGSAPDRTEALFLVPFPISRVKRWTFNHQSRLTNRPRDRVKSCQLQRARAGRGLGFGRKDESTIFFNRTCTLLVRSIATSGARRLDRGTHTQPCVRPPSSPFPIHFAERLTPALVDSYRTPGIQTHKGNKESTEVAWIRRISCSRV